MPPPTRAPLPTGTLTFLLTDIEGSTRMWESAPDAMQTALSRHDAILRQSIEAHGGHVFKTAGDAFFAAFATPWLALEAALAAQQALQAEPWPPEAPIRVRMALHSGAAELRDADYFGPPLNHVARLVSAGYGGQTLVSAVTCELCNDRLPVGVTMKSLGEHGLKDLARRQTIYQLGHPSLPQAFPPLRTLLAPLDASVPSIAVLPFVNMSRDEENEYFADGLSEELLNVLAKIEGLRVASRTSAFSFKGAQVDIPTIAQQLGVAHLLEGSVRKAGSRVRITAQLVHVATDSHLWSQTYDRELDDIFAVQDDIAHAVVTEMRSAFMHEGFAAPGSAQVTAEVQSAVKGRSRNAEAYRLHLQGTYFMNRYSEEDMAKAIGYFRHAVDLDPEFASAWASLSYCYLNQGASGWVPLAQGAERARETARRALEVEPELAAGHWALGSVHMYYDWDWKAAESCIRRALRLAPDDSLLAVRAATLLLNLGQVEEAGALTRRALVLDPLNATAHVMSGWLLGLAGRLDEAESACRKALELGPSRVKIHFRLCEVHLLQGRAEDALQEAEREVEEPFRLLGIALAERALGHAAKSDAALDELIREHGEAAAYQIAGVYAMRGDPDRAFEWLERAYRQRDAGLASIQVDRLLRGLHDDSRWRRLLEKMGFAE